jgi:hypothetical protein
MARVLAFQIDGVSCWFWSNDHEPPHFHAKRAGEWEVSVRFLEARSRMILLKWSKRKLSRQETKTLVENSEKFRAELLDQWEKIQEQNNE